MIVLGIESSCDETSVSIVQEKNGRGKILSEKILSQVKKHRPYGGVVPELASREHSNCISNLTRQVLSETSLNLNDIDAFAATTGFSCFKDLSDESMEVHVFRQCGDCGTSG